MRAKVQARREVKNLFKGRPPDCVAYRTSKGRMLHGQTEDLDGQGALSRVEGKVQLIFTSPPFPLNRKKKYGNLQGSDYIDWLAGFGPVFKRLLRPKGSIVIELGNSWQKGSPTMSTLAIRALLEFKERNNLHLCQEFVWHNPAKLPTPVQWVNRERIRVKDTYTRLWWLSKTKRPKASNRRVLQEYSPSMRTLLKNKTYNSGKRPSQHLIGAKSFLTDNGGAIPGNVIIAANTNSHDSYHRYCSIESLALHPARMPLDLAKFFVKFLTTPGDLVFDPFAGSNTTGAVAESLDRFWLSVEPSKDYIAGSKGRFPALAELVGRS